MPDRPRLAAASRTVTGKAVARLRSDGLLPAVVYGHGAASEPVSLDAHEFEQLRRHMGATTLVDLTVDGAKARPVLVHGVQVHPVTRRPFHVDLFAVRMTEELTVDVPLIATGTAPAAELGGTLVHPTSTVKVRALPDHLPDSLDLLPLVAGRATTSRSTSATSRSPEGATLATELGEVVARVLAPRVEEEVAPSGRRRGPRAPRRAAEGAAGEGAGPVRGEG